MHNKTCLKRGLLKRKEFASSVRIGKAVVHLRSIQPQAYNNVIETKTKWNMFPVFGTFRNTIYWIFFIVLLLCILLVCCLVI